MLLKFVSQIAGEPSTLAEIKAFLRIDTDDEDTLLGLFQKAARDQAEAYLKRALLLTTYDGFIDSFPPGQGVVEFPVPPLSSVTSIKYLDSAGVQQTWDAADYTVDIDSDRGRVYPIYNGAYPITQAIRKAVEIRFVAGYATVADIPEAIVHGIKMLVATLYENREDFVVGNVVNKIPFTAQKLFHPHVAWTP